MGGCIDALILSIDGAVMVIGQMFTESAAKNLEQVANLLNA